MEEISQKAPHHDVAATSGNESQETKRAEPTTNEQLRTALECVVEAGKYSQEPLFTALVCDVCAVCESIGLLEMAGVQSGIFYFLFVDFI